MDVNKICSQNVPRDINRKQRFLDRPSMAISENNEKYKIELISYDSLRLAISELNDVSSTESLHLDLGISRNDCSISYDCWSAAVDEFVKTLSELRFIKRLSIWVYSNHDFQVKMSLPNNLEHLFIPIGNKRLIVKGGSNLKSINVGRNLETVISIHPFLFSYLRNDAVITITLKHFSVGSLIHIFNSLMSIYRLYGNVIHFITRQDIDELKFDINRAWDKILNLCPTITYPVLKFFVTCSFLNGTSRKHKFCLTNNTSIMEDA